MRIFFTGFLYLALLTIPSLPAQAKDWRGIFPLKSTHSDVVRILGEPQTSNEYQVAYQLKEAKVEIIFTNLVIKFEGSINLPADVVYQIIVESKTLSPLADLKLDLAAYKKFDPSYPVNSGYDGYINKDEGLILMTFNGAIKRAEYFPDAEKQKLCPKCYEGLEGVRIISCR